MKKIIFLFAMIVGCYGLSNAQKVLNSQKEVVGYITGEGVVLDSAYNTVGYFKNDGSIMNADYVTVGYVKSDGTIRTSTGQRVGAISNGFVYNAKKVLIGTIGSNGDLTDSQGRVVASLKNVEQDLGAISIFFFFKLAGTDYYNDYKPSAGTTASISKTK